MHSTKIVKLEFTMHFEKDLSICESQTYSNWVTANQKEATKSNDCQYILTNLSKKFYFVLIHPCKPLKNELPFAKNSPTDCDVDESNSHKNVVENKSDYSLDPSINSVSQCKTSDESGGGRMTQMEKRWWVIAWVCLNWRQCIWWQSCCYLWCCNG